MHWSTNIVLKRGRVYRIFKCTRNLDLEPLQQNDLLLFIQHNKAHIGPTILQEYRFFNLVTSNYNWLIEAELHVLEELV